ncbi:MAG: DegT/DnrJ/EryC1/StrS family aminotransferase [Candidatus Komeilibacteria bacterium]|nr:DegT/DnrJ/EryC1/StrS family aminotransferase [Candidatus Komeilibacteria bacterium]
MFVPVNEPLLSKEAKANVTQALETGWISSSGSFVKQFEDDFAKRFGVKYAVTVANGTAALHVGLLALGIGVGDEVIVPAFTMAASWMAVMYTGAKPVFVDSERETYNIDVNKIEQKITPKTKAIMPVHIYGQPCAMEQILALAKKHNLFVIEDAAEAHGATYRGQLAGTFGDLGCFSFYANKIITTGEGGMIITNNQDLADKARKFKDLHHSEKRFIHDGLGYNYRMTNLQAAVGCGELLHLEEYIEKKVWMANLYNQLLSDTAGIVTPKTIAATTNVYWMYAIVIDAKVFGLNRDELRIKLKEVGVDTRDFFYSPSDQPVLKDIVVGEEFPETTYLAERGLYLPSGLAITEEQITYVCDQIKQLKK